MTHSSSTPQNRCIAIAASLIVLLLAGCSGLSSSSNRSDQSSVDCEGALATVLAREKSGDTAGAINSELDWLTQNCSSEYGIFTDYVSAKGMAEQFGPDTCDSLAQHIGREAIGLLSADGLCSGGAAGSAAEAPDVESQHGGGIAWNEAVNFAGTVQRVCGPLAGSGNSEDDVFLNLGLDYPDPGRFQIVLWDIGGIEPIAFGATLCTSGQITLYEGVAQIELESAGEVEIYG